MKRITLAFTFILLHLFAFSQKEWSNWYNSGNELLTFKNGFPEKVTGFINPIPSFPPYQNLYHFYYWGEGGISYSDPTTGDLKFIISKRFGFSKDFNRFPNDTLLRSCPDQKSYHIIPFKSDANKFYVIQFQSATADLLAQETGLQVRCPNAIGLAYSIVDLSKNGGLGDFTSTNNFISGGLTEQITTVKHANGIDVWIIVHPYGTAQYNAILVTDAGIQAPVISNIGAAVNGGSKSTEGDITASHDGKLLAGCRSLVQNTGSESDIELFDFNNATGQLSNYRTMPSEGHVLKLQFSPDNTKLYTVGFDADYNNSIINQWDFNQADVAGSKTTVEKIGAGSLWDMQLAPDGKIYLSSFQEYTTNNSRNYLVAIQCPNLPQFACNINKRAIEVNRAAFPALVNDFINVAKVPLLPKFSIGNDTAICFGSLVLTAPAGWQSYRWNTGDTGKSITVTKAGVYYVLTGSLGFSCPTGYGYINVADKAIKLDLGKDTFLCQKTAYKLHVPDNYNNILWGNGSNTRDSLLFGGGNISISANDQNGCYTDDTIVVAYNYYPRAEFGNDTVLCNNQTLSLELQPTGAFGEIADYAWQDNSTKPYFTVTTPGTYWGKITYKGCTTSDTIKVSYVSAQNVSIGNDTTVCMGDSLLLSSSIGNAKYLWNTGDTTQSIFVKYPGIYTIRVSNDVCSLTDTIRVNFISKPIFSLGSDTAICQNNLLQLMPNVTSGTYLWQDGATSDKYTVTKSGLYWLRFSQIGCTVSDSINVVFKNLPPVNLGKDTGFCAGKSLVLDAYNAAIQSYLWQDQSTAATYTARFTGSFAVTVTGNNGCKNQDTVLLTVVPLPAFSLGNDTTVCNGQIFSLGVFSAGATYLWNDGSKGNQLLVKSPGNYWLTINQQGCSKSDSITVSYKPVPIVKLGADTTLCEGITQQLNVANANATYQWQDGSTGSNFTIQRAGLYFVSVDINGCKAADSINILYTPTPVFTLGRDTFLCKGQSLLLRPVLNTAVEYRWQDGSTFSSYNITDTGKFILTVANDCGSASSSVIISQGICQLYIPTAFSPNNDNLNDIFRVKYPFEVKKFRMSIYNRYGQKIFETAEMRKGWDGNFNGSLQPGGAYVWVISLTDIDGRDKTVNGTVMLVK